MTPAEDAYYLDVPNVVIVQDPPNWKYRFEPPFDQYALALRPFKRILWSVVGSGGYTTPEYREQVLDLVKGIPNLAGVYLDDFFFTKVRHAKDGKWAALTLDKLGEIRQRLKSSGRQLEMAVTFYTQLLDLPLGDYRKLLDVLTLWTWNSEGLKDLELNLGKTEKLAPGMRKRLGCYFFDFTKKKSVPVAATQYQCETGLRLLRQGRIEGIVLIGNTEEDLGFESVEWTRDWIKRVGDLAI